MAIYISAYKTADGKIFESREEADLHDIKLNYTQYYNDNPVPHNPVPHISYDEFMSWLDNSAVDQLQALKSVIDAELDTLRWSSYRAKAADITEDDKI